MLTSAAVVARQMSGEDFAKPRNQLLASVLEGMDGRRADGELVHDPWRKSNNRPTNTIQMTQGEDDECKREGE
jgi:hypothetical protein